MYNLFTSGSKNINEKDIKGNLPMSPWGNFDVDFCNCLSALANAVNGIAIHASPC